MYRKFVKRTLALAGALLLCWMALIAALDPFFHYHLPLFGMEPVVDNERYQNPGIAERFPYDSMILGSSMAENFRTGWFDEEFDCASVKLTFSAARTGAYRWMLEKGFETRQLKNVFLGLDNDSLIVAYGTYMFPLPEYLYDKNPLNDVEYLMDASVLEPALDLVKLNLRDRVPPLEDAYVWDAPGLYGEERVLRSVKWDMEEQSYQRDCSRFLDNCRENLEKNILPYVREHPETQFFIFLPPYSVLWWNQMWNSGQLEARLDVTRELMELLLPYDNVSLFCFQDRRDVVCDFDNYKDYNHYSAQISRQLVSWMAAGEGLVTEENKETVLNDIREMALGFDYGALKEKMEKEGS